MNPLETQSNPNTEATVRGLQEELQSLRALVVVSLLVLNVLSGALYMYLHNQSTLKVFEAAEAAKNVTEFRAKFDPIAREFWVQLSLFSRSHPDFKPVLDKYQPYFNKAYPPGAKPAAPPAK